MRCSVERVRVGSRVAARRSGVRTPRSQPEPWRTMDTAGSARGRDDAWEHRADCVDGAAVQVVDAHTVCGWLGDAHRLPMCSARHVARCHVAHYAWMGGPHYLSVSGRAVGVGAVATSVSSGQPLTSGEYRGEAQLVSSWVHTAVPPLNRHVSDRHMHAIACPGPALDAI